MGNMSLVQFKKDLRTLMDADDLKLPSNVSPEGFRNAAIVAVQENPKILECEPASVMKALRKLTAVGLLADGKEAAIVPFKGVATAMPMVFGIISMAYRSGKVKEIRAHLVYQKELDEGRFDYQIGDEERLEHRPILFGDRGDAIAAYAVARLTDGSLVREFMSADDIDKVRRTGASQRVKKGQAWVVSDDPVGIWKDHSGEMWKKTVIRRLAKRLPLSGEDLSRINFDVDNQEIRDVTPKESTEERLLRHSRERAEPTKEDQVEAEIEDAEVMAPEFDKSLVSPMDKAFDEGVAAFEKGIAEDGCPYETNPEFSQWIGGHRQAADFAKEREALDGKEE